MGTRRVLLSWHCPAAENSRQGSARAEAQPAKSSLQLRSPLQQRVAASLAVAQSPTKIRQGGTKRKVRPSSSTCM